VGRPLGLDATAAARGVFDVVNANMANAVAVYTAEKGVDVRDYTLFAFGGAAPAHAWDVARRLRIGRVLVPPWAGVLSALGCVLSPLSFDFSLGYMRELSRVDWGHLERAFGDMEAQGRRLLAEAGVEQATVERSADMRYLGQRYEVNFGLPDGRLGPRHLPEIGEAFYAAYREQYGREIREVPIEAVTWRLRVSGPRPEVRLAAGPRGGGRPSPKSRRPVHFEAGFVESAVYDRAELGAGARIAGPAVVEDRESTAVIPPGARASVDPLGTLIIELS
jgi:N-methylhydantoinase A/oxoprolinase/acetone carboxylase beta subunit